MDLPSQIKFNQELKHFVNVYFGGDDIQDVVDHAKNSLSVCNTCKMFYGVIQSIQDSILGYKEELFDLRNLTFGGGGAGGSIYVGAAGGGGLGTMTTVSFQYDES